MSNQSQKNELTSELIDKVLERSGYLFECRVAKELNDLGFEIEANLGFEDPEEKKSREVDITALISKDYHIASPYAKRRMRFSIRLVVECISSKIPMVFFSRPKARELPFPMCNFSRPLESDRGGAPLMQDLVTLNRQDMEDFHYYKNDSICSQFCTFRQTKKKEWIALHEDSHYHTLRNIYHACSFLSRQNKKRLVGQASYSVELLIPVIVFDGTIYKVTVDNDSYKKDKTNRVLFLANQAIDNTAKSYFVDIVQKEDLESYTELIKTEFDTLQNTSQEKYLEFLKDINFLPG